MFAIIYAVYCLNIIIIIHVHYDNMTEIVKTKVNESPHACNTPGPHDSTLLISTKITNSIPCLTFLWTITCTIIKSNLFNAHL